MIYVLKQCTHSFVHPVLSCVSVPCLVRYVCVHWCAHATGWRWSGRAGRCCCCCWHECWCWCRPTHTRSAGANISAVGGRESGPVLSPLLCALLCSLCCLAHQRSYGKYALHTHQRNSHLASSRSSPRPFVLLLADQFSTRSLVFYLSVCLLRWMPRVLCCIVSSLSLLCLCVRHATRVLVVLVCFLLDVVQYCMLYCAVLYWTLMLLLCCIELCCM